MSDDAERPDTERADAGAPSGSPAPSPAEAQGAKDAHEGHAAHGGAGAAAHDGAPDVQAHEAHGVREAAHESEVQEGQEAREAPDADAWAAACEEDLEAEKARRRAQYGAPPTSAAEELRRLADAVTEKVAEFGKPFAGAAAAGAAQGVAQQFIAQAKASIEPVVERNPQFFDHLAAAGSELLAAYRAAVHESERRWTEPTDANGDDLASGAERIDLDRLDEQGKRGEQDDPRDGGSGERGERSGG